MAPAFIKLSAFSDLNLSVPVSYQHPTSPYITRSNKDISNEKMQIDQIKQTTED